MNASAISPSKTLDRVLLLELTCVTEATAIAASALTGRGDEHAADSAAAQAMRATAKWEGDLPADGLRANGVGSREPVEGLDPADPANRRIEFTVIATEPLMPTPIDTPGPR